MAITEYVGGESYGGTVIASDVRYGETFLNIDLVDKAAPGEVLKDPLTGELFLKKSIDGKVVSFAQKNSNVFDFLSEFNTIFQSSQGFIYPAKVGAYLIGTRYDINTIATGVRGESVDIYKDNISATISFEPSQETNGFFIKPILRNGDRISVGWLSGKFRDDEDTNFSGITETFKSFLATNLNYKDEYLYDSWKKLSGWARSNAIIDISVRVSGYSSGSKMTISSFFSYPIRLNEQNYIRINTGKIEVSSIAVSITKIYFPKLQYEYHIEESPSASNGLGNPLGALVEADLRACLRSLEIYYFITSRAQIPFGDNRVIHQCIDYESFAEGIDKVLTASGTRSVQSMVEKPSTWGIDSIWAEELRNIEPGGGGESIETGSENTMESLEEEIYRYPDESSLSFTQYLTDRDNIYIEGLSS